MMEVNTEVQADSWVEKTYIPEVKQESPKEIKAPIIKQEAKEETKAPAKNLFKIEKREVKIELKKRDSPARDMTTATDYCQSPNKTREDE